MSAFPRTTVGGISMPRLICGTNWFLGYSHFSKAKDKTLTEIFDTPSKIADVVEVFLKHGCDAVMGPLQEFLAQGLREAEQRVGRRIIWVCTPAYAEVGNPDTWKQSVDKAKAMGATFCFPHESVTRSQFDHETKTLSPRLNAELRYVREAGMIPGLSTHAPEAVICADSSEADVESYTLPYNSIGFLCHVETDWMQKVIHNAHKPVMIIKPLAAGRIMPPTGLNFVWRTIRDRDMVTIGTMSTYEAEEVIELSLACLQQRQANVELQFTRSKRTLVPDP